MSGFRVLQPGLMTLITDRGRFGHHRIGLTTGGPLDPLAFDWANRLLGNDANATGLEISIGGLVLEAQVDTWDRTHRRRAAAEDQWQGAGTLVRPAGKGR